MQHQLWARRSIISAVVTASLGLAACGSGGGASSNSGTVETTTTLSGIVADGYLLNATVCLDINLNKMCDSGEPTATSTSGGNYSLDATQTQIDTYPIVAEIVAGITIDEDNPGSPVTKAYTLSAPAGKGAFISPLTTIVQAQIETTGRTAEQIESEILASIGQDPSLISLFDNYVSNKSDATNSSAVQNSYLQLHQVAQVTARTIANNLEIIETAVSNGEIQINQSETLDSLITIIVQQVIAELANISTEIDNAVSFDADTIAAAVDATVDTTTIEGQVAVTEATSNAAVTSNVESIFSTGLSWLWAEFLPWKNEMERSTIIYDTVTGTLSEPIESFFETGMQGSWFLLSSTADSLVLQANGAWAAVTDSWDGVSITFDNTAGTATVDSNRGMEALSNIKTIDLTGLNIKAFVENKLPKVSAAVFNAPPGLSAYIDPTAVFSAGSIAYSLNATTLEDTYSIRTSASCPSCNTVIDNSTGSAFTLLADIPSPAVAWVDPGTLGDLPMTYGVSAVANLYFEVVQGDTNISGPVNYYHNPTGTPDVTKVGTGTWSMITVNGVEMLMVDHPDALMNQFSALATDVESPQENHFFVVQDFAVRKGSYMPANVVETTAESLLTNQQAQNEIVGAFITATIINTIPSVDLTCESDSGWNPLIDKPLVSYSFADYKAVVTACGGALPVDTNALVFDASGATRNHYLSNGSYVQFNADNTGTYQRDGVNTSFNWVVDAATSYITIEDSSASFRDILAAVSMDSTVDPVVFTFKGYIEQIGRSDMVTNQGSDGEI